LSSFNLFKVGFVRFYVAVPVRKAVLIFLVHSRNDLKLRAIAVEKKICETKSWRG